MVGKDPFSWALFPSRMHRSPGKRHGFASAVQVLIFFAAVPVTIRRARYRVLAVTAATFEDGTEWRPDPNRLTESVEKTARELVAVEHEG